MIRTGRSWVLLAWLLAMMISPQTLAAGPGVPEILAPVTDLAGVLPEGAEAQISKRLEEHRTATNVHIAVLTIRSTRGVPIEDYALQVAMQWGGGSREDDDGALFVLAVDDRQMRLELGYGLEAPIPDAQARRLLDAAIPDLRRQDYANATHTVVEGVIGMTGGTSRADEPLVAVSADPMESWTPDPIESWTPGVDVEPPRLRSSSPFELDFSTSAFVLLVIAIGMGFAGVVLRQRADAEQLKEKAAREEEEIVQDWDLPPLGKHVLVLVAIVVGVGTIAFVLGFGVPTLFVGLLGATLGYLILPAFSGSTAFSGTATSSGSSSRTSWTSSSTTRSIGSSSFGRSSSGGSSRSSWSGGGGRFGGGGASSRW